MKILTRGQKVALSNEQNKLIVGLKWDQSQNPGYEIDSSLMLLSARGKLEEEENFIFYNNLSSSCGSVKMDSSPLSGYKKSINLNLDKIPADISRLLFLITIDNGDQLNHRFGNIKNITVEFLDTAKNVFVQFLIDSLSKETALIAVEIYKHNNEWKIQATGNGFNSGLSAILKEYGSEKVQVQETNTTVKPSEKKEAPIPAGSIDFVKKHKSRIDLAKKQVAKLGIADQKAQVVIIMDISFSMQKMFKTGVVQDTFDRVLPLAMQFDDDGSMDVWLFHNNAFNHATPYTLSNRENYINLEILPTYTWGGTDYAPVINQVTEKYNSAGKGTDPCFVLFFTDGGCSDKAQSKEAMKNASNKGIFWKFIGMGSSKSGYEFLVKLDELKDRKIDNANFFHIADLNKIDDETLYKGLLEEFPDWLAGAKKLGIIG